GYAAASPAPHVKARDGRPIGIRLTPFVLIQVRGERVIRLAAPGPPSGSRPDRGLRRGRAAPRCTRPFSSGSRFEANGDARPGSGGARTRAFDDRSSPSGGNGRQRRRSPTVSAA